MKFTLFLLLLVSCPCFSITFEAAVGLYTNKNYQKAYAAFDELAHLGNERAQFNIAVMHARGESVPKNHVKALAWARLAKDSGSKNAVKVIPIFEKKLDDSGLKSAKEYYTDLQVQYGETFIRDNILLEFPEQSGDIKSSRVTYLASPKYPQHLANKEIYGGVDLQLTVGKDGTGRFFTIVSSPHKDFSRAVLDAIKRSKVNPAMVDGRSILEFSNSYRFNFQMEGSTVKASVFQQYLNDQKEKAEQGTSQDKLFYAHQLRGLKSSVSSMKGAEDVVWQNPLVWYQKAAQDGASLAKYELGVQALSGGQCNLDSAKSLFWLTSASDENVLDAQLALGYEYITGVRFNRDVEKGFHLIKSASDKGLDHAQVLYSWLLTTLGVTETRQLELAEQALDKINVKEYTDLRSYYEARAALDLAKSNWKNAKKNIKKLSKLNRKYDVSNERELALFSAYKDKKIYIEQP